MLTRVFLPVAAPGLIAATLFAFTVSWAQFLYPLAYIYKETEMVLTTGIYTTLIRGDVYFWGELMGGALLASVPVVVLFAFLMDSHIAGLTRGTIK
jgi:multiple sugar transport system permease protein